MKKRAIPPVPINVDRSRYSFDSAVKENLEILQGRRGDRIALLDATGLSGNDLTLAIKINEIIEMFQDI